MLKLQDSKPMEGPMDIEPTDPTLQRHVNTRHGSKARGVEDQEEGRSTEVETLLCSTEASWKAGSPAGSMMKPSHQAVAGRMYQSCSFERR
jgi:hypothetical protein